MELYVEVVDKMSKWHDRLMQLFRAGNLPNNTIHDIVDKGQGYTVWISLRDMPICMCTLQRIGICDGNTAWMIDNIVTHPGYRGQGLASRLLKFVIEKYGNDELRLEAKSDLVGYYEKFGFESTKRRVIYDSCTYIEMSIC